jgi:hypothetical protein
MLSGIMPSAFLLDVILLCFIVLTPQMLMGHYAKCVFAGCHFAEFHCAHSPNAEWHYATIVLVVILLSFIVLTPLMLSGIMPSAF